MGYCIKLIVLKLVRTIKSLNERIDNFLEVAQALMFTMNVSKPY